MAKITAARFMARYQVHKLHDFVFKHWSELYVRLHPEAKSKMSEESGRSHNFIAELAFGRGGNGIAQNWSHCTLKDNAGIERKMLETFRDNPSRVLEAGKDIGEEKKWDSQDYYEDKINNLLASFNDGFEWDDEKFDWRLTFDPTFKWPLKEILQPDLVSGFEGTVWYLYKYQERSVSKKRGIRGIERQILRIDKIKNNEGVYGVSIEGVGELNEELICFRGRAFSDRIGRIVFVLQDFHGLSAYMILFIDKSLNVNGADRNVALGHFTYFSHHQAKTLTKSVILTKQNDDSTIFPVKLILDTDIDPDNDFEKLVLFFLRDKEANRLTSVAKPIFTQSYFRDWVEKANSDIFPKEASRTTEYFVYYIKKKQEAAKLDSIEFELFTDKMLVSQTDTSTSDPVEYQHFESVQHKQRRLLGVFKGELTWKSSLWYGLLHSSQQNPLFVNIHVPEETVADVECLIGSLTGKDDVDSGIMVSYTCVAVPDSFLAKQDVSHRAVIDEKIMAYLIREASKGWSVVDPSRKHIFSFKIDALDSDL